MPEVADPPVETKVPPVAHPGAITIDLGNLGQKATPAKKVETPVPDADATKAAEADKAAKEAAAKESEAKAAEAAAAEASKSKTNDKEENLANLRKAREAAELARKAAEEERDRIKAEYEAIKGKAPELPEDVQKRLKELEEERETLRRTVRETDLARDPEFQAKYNTPITERIGAMGQTALAAGVNKADWEQALATWDENQFAEWMETMNPVQRVKFQAAWTAAVDLYQQQQAELKNADTTYQELQKRRQAEMEVQQKQYFAQNEQLAKSILAETIKPETLKEYEDLGPAAEALLLKAARHEIPAKDIFQQLAANQVLARVTTKQANRITELEAQLAERDKKISEQDSFISTHASAVPRGGAAGSSAPAQDKVTPLWENIQVRASG